MKFGHSWFAVLIGALVCLPAFAQSVQLTALLPSAAPGVATAPGTATIMGAAGRGTGTVTVTLPGAAPVIPCPAGSGRSGQCLGPVTAQVTHTLAGFDRFTLSLTDDGLKPRQVGNTQIRQCLVQEFVNPAPKNFNCEFDWLPYTPSAAAVTKIRVDVLTQNNFVDRNYIVDYQWGAASTPTCAASVSSFPQMKSTSGVLAAAACKDEISVDLVRPGPSDNRVMALAEELPAFCATGKYSLRDGRQARIVLVLRDEQNRTLATSEQFFRSEPATNQLWGTSCLDAGNAAFTKGDLVFIREKKFEDLRRQNLWPYTLDLTTTKAANEVLGTLKLVAVLVDFNTGTPILESSPVSYDIVPGGKLISSKFLMSRKNGSTLEINPEGVILSPQTVLEDGLFEPKKSPDTLLKAIATSYNSRFDAQGLDLELEVDVPAAGNLTVEFVGVDYLDRPVAAELKSSAEPVERGRSRVTLHLAGNLPRNAKRLNILPKLEIRYTQNIFLPLIEIPVNALIINGISPEPGACSFDRPDQCLKPGQETDIAVQLVALPGETVQDIHHLAIFGSDTEVSVNTGKDGSLVGPFFGGVPRQVTHTKKVGPLVEPKWLSVGYRLHNCSRVEICAVTVETYKSFSNGAVQIGGTILDTADAIAGGRLRGIRLVSPVFVSSIRRTEDKARVAIDYLRGRLPKLGVQLPRPGAVGTPSATAPSSELLTLGGSLEFQPTIPANGSFSAQLVLRYSSVDLGDDPNFAENKIQIASRDNIGAWRLYPTTVDTARKEVTATIDSLQPYYTLAVAAPFPFEPIMIPTAATGFAIVNVGPQAANLRAANPTADGANTATKAATLAPLNMTRTLTGTGWVKTWADSASVAAASWQETGRLLAITPSSKPDAAFVLPYVETGGRKSTELQLANAGPGEAEVSLVLYTPSGTRQGTFDFSLSAGTSRSYRLKAMFPDLPDGFIGYVLISSGRPIVVSAVLANNASLVSEIAQAADAALGATTKFALIAGEGKVNATVHLVNLGAGAATVTLRPRLASGAAGADVRVTLQAGQQYTRLIEELFGTAAVASVTIISSAGGVAGDILAEDAAFQSQYRISAPFVDLGSANAVLPYAAGRTTVTVFNPGSAAANISVTPYAANGTPGTAANATVAAGGTSQVVVQSSGFVVIRGSQPVLSAALVASAAGGMAGYPAIAVGATASGGAASGPTPAATAAGVLNAASFKGGAVAPGELITIFGSDMGPAALTTLRLENGRVATELNGARVFFDGVAAPMVYTVAGQGAVIVPYSVAGKTSTQMVVEYQGRQSAPVTIPVAAAAPGLFSSNSSGTGQGAIGNQNGSLNSASNPAAVGSVVVLYGTGEGAVTPSVPDGAVNSSVFPKPAQPFGVSIGGRSANLLYYGAAPGLVAGIFQANVEVPTGLATGAQPVVVTVGTASSQAGLTLAVMGVGTISAPRISVNPASLSFGNTQVGQSSTQTVAVSNTGTAALSVNAAVTGTGYSLTSAPAISVNPNTTQNVTVRFAPTAAGAVAGTLTLTHNDTTQSSPVRVTLSGTGTASTPAINVAPTGANFGNVTVGQPADSVFIVSSTGTAPVTISALTLQNAAFTLVSPPQLPYTIGDAALALRVRFTPSSTGAQAGALTIASNDPARPTVTLTLTGTGTGATGGTTSGANLLCNGSFEQPGTTASFLTIPTGNTSIPCWSVTRADVDYIGGYWISFDGKQSIDLDGNSPGAIAQTFATRPDTTYTVAFRMSGHPGGPKSVRASVASQTVDFTFDAVGRSYTDMKWELKTFTFRSTAAATTLAFASLSASGSFGAGIDDVCVAEGSTPCSSASGGSAAAIEVSPTTLDFGSAIVSASNTRTITVRNIGTAPLTISFVSSSNAQFVLVDSLPPFTLQAGTSRVMTFRFTPTGAASTSGTITISSNDPVRPSVTISVTGSVGQAGGGGVGTSIRIPATAVAGWPNGRTSNQLPTLAIDGNTSTYTWTTESFANVNPSYIGISFAASTSVNRIRLYKDNDAGGPGLIAKNLTIEYTTSAASVPLSSRVWTPVSGLVNSFSGIEPLTAAAVNANGTVSADNHNSLVSGFASLTFNAVEATGVRIGFSNVSAICCNHYRVYEFEAYGGGTASSGARTIGFGQTINGTLSAGSGRSSDCSACYTDTYQFTVTAARNVVISLNSAAFDAYLNLLDENGNNLGSNDDGGGGTNARLSGTIQPGIYRIEATTAEAGMFGAYTLSIAP